ncbi:MAG TPA: hypothetical protein V6C65_36165 [Allocoleopsis sp.]
MTMIHDDRGLYRFDLRIVQIGVGANRVGIAFPQEISPLQKGDVSSNLFKPV